MRATVILLLLAAAPAAAQTHVLIVSGIGGEPRYQQRFMETGLAVAAAAEQRLHVPAERIRYLAEDAARDARIAGRSTKDAVAAELGRLAGAMEPRATLLIVLIGHGSGSAESPRINLPGPDLTAQDFAALLVPFATQQIIVVNATSASGDWVRILAGPNRAVITATRSAVEREETQFATQFAAALGSDDADRDKDGRLSLLEAFEYARLELARVYERDQRLRTEHALLEADGDGVGAMEPVLTEGDGAAAAALFLGGTARAAEGGLAAVRDSLEREVIRLRSRKASLPADEYDRQLETLLLDLARVNREIREREGRQ